MKKSLLKRHTLLRVNLLALLLWGLSLPALAEWHSATGQAMGTEIHVELWHDDADRAQAAMDAVLEEMHRVDQRFSPWLAESELSRINARAAAEPQRLSEELAFILERALFYSQLTQGAFDITFASLGRHYDFRAKQQPTPQERERLLSAIDFKQLNFDRDAGRLSFRDPDLSIDLGGIAKGYAVDRAIALLREEGVSHAAVSAGGDSRVLGDRRGRPWMIGIKKPRSLPGDDEPAIAIPLEDAAISTSGDYERYFIDPETGQRVHHILNPTTGQPVEGVVSVSVIGRDGIDTDALSTSVFVLGVEEGLALINALPNFDCVIIDSAGTVHFSDGLTEPPTDADSPAAR
jgi:thiamine biosynthesis lipoprotein